MTERWYWTPEIAELARLIRLREAPAGYNQRFAESVPRRDLATMTFDEVRRYGRERVTVDHKSSSAIGGYQFISRTLDGLKASLHLTGREPFTPELQDDLAYQLMVGRGLNRLYAGTMPPEVFCNNIAREWASLPVVTAIRGAHRMLRPGQSYYAGDGLNAAHHRPETILAAVRAIAAAGRPSPSEPAVVVNPTGDIGRWAGPPEKPAEPPRPADGLGPADDDASPSPPAAAPRSGLPGWIAGGVAVAVVAVVALHALGVL